MKTTQSNTQATANLEAQASTTLPVKDLVPATETKAETKKAKKLPKKSAKKANITLIDATKGEVKVTPTKNGGAKLEVKNLKGEKKSSAKTKAIKDTAKSQANSIKEEVISNRDVKYIYPEDVKDTLSRKSWRQQVRNKLYKLEREMNRIQDQNSKEYKKAKKALLDYQKEVLKPNQAV